MYMYMYDAGKLHGLSCPMSILFAARDNGKPICSSPPIMLLDNATNYTLFRDCFTSALMQRVAPASSIKPKKKRLQKGSKSKGFEKTQQLDLEKVNNEAAIGLSSDTQSLADDLTDFAEVSVMATGAAEPFS
jgi:hypothetical protein